MRAVCIRAVRYLAAQTKCAHLAWLHAYDLSGGDSGAFARIGRRTERGARLAHAAAGEIYTSRQSVISLPIAISNGRRLQMGVRRGGGGAAACAELYVDDD